MSCCKAHPEQWVQLPWLGWSSGYAIISLNSVQVDCGLPVPLNQVCDPSPTYKCTSKRAAEVTCKLLDILLLFGAPAILQTVNGPEFTVHVITKLKELWPHLIMVHDKPRHPQSQGWVEHANGDIKDMLVAWVWDNNTQDLSVGLHLVQNMKKKQLIKCTPYKAMFGSDPEVGLTSSSICLEVLDTPNRSWPACSLSCS